MYHIAFASDNGYALQLKISVASLLHACRNNPSGFVVNILDDGIDDSAWNQMLKTWQEILPQANIHRHKITSFSFKEFRAWKGSLTAYARLLLPTILNDAEWCLYADCDTFFVKDPRILWTEKHSDSYIIGHTIANGRQEHGDVWWLRERGYEPDPNLYLCSGLLLMNLSAFREYQISSQCIEFLTEHPDSITADQCALNITCQGHMQEFSAGWGVFMDEAMKSPFCGCIHFAGLPPWKPATRWTHFCGEDKVFDLWYDFAETKCHASGLRDTYQPRQSFPRMAGSIIYPILIALSFAHIYPKSYEKHAQSIRERIFAHVPATIRKELNLV